MLSVAEPPEVKLRPFNEPCRKQFRQGSFFILRRRSVEPSLRLGVGPAGLRFQAALQAGE
jgi:hypothetical protein